MTTEEMVMWICIWAIAGLVGWVIGSVVSR